MSCTKNAAGNPDTSNNNSYTVNLGITGVKIGAANTSGKYRMITFDIQRGNNYIPLLGLSLTCISTVFDSTLFMMNLRLNSPY